MTLEAFVKKYGTHSSSIMVRQATAKADAAWGSLAMELDAMAKDLQDMLAHEARKR